MDAALEVWSLSGRAHVQLTHDRCTVGKGEENDLVLADDPTVSRLHAVLERFPAGWCVTESEAESPSLTPRERDVLVVLCRPLLARDLFTEPASIREIAADLVVSEAAVKQHLVNLYAKFDVGEAPTHRRARLANEAIRRGAVTLADLRRGEEA